MATDMRPILASESGSYFKKDICLYVCVTRRNSKKDEPNLAFSKTSSVNVNLLNTKTSKGVNFYLESTIPAYILKKTEALMFHAINNAGNGADSSEDAQPVSPAYTVKIAFGKYKGLTPAEALLRDGNQAAADLGKTFEMLKQNYNDPSKAKYRDGNLKQLNAISDAAALYNANQLVKSNTYPQIVIWEGMRTPNNKKVNAQGLTEARTMTISYDTNPAADEPYKIEIMNCMAPPVQNARIGAQLKYAQDKETLSMTFPEDAWYGLWKDIVDAKGAFARTIEADKISYSEANTWKPSVVQDDFQNNVVQYQQSQNQYNNGYNNGYGYNSSFYTQ